MIHLHLAAIIAVLLVAELATAQTKTFCSEPVTPFCASRPGVFEDDTARDRCREEVESYVAGMETYIDCLDTQQEEAAERGKQIEERFACMTEGRDDCR